MAKAQMQDWKKRWFNKFKKENDEINHQNSGVVGVASMTIAALNLHAQTDAENV